MCACGCHIDSLYVYARVQEASERVYERVHGSVGGCIGSRGCLRDQYGGQTHRHPPRKGQLDLRNSLLILLILLLLILLPLAGIFLLRALTLTCSDLTSFSAFLSFPDRFLFLSLPRLPAVMVRRRWDPSFFFLVSFGKELRVPLREVESLCFKICFENLVQGSSVLQRDGFLSSFPFKPDFDEGFFPFLIAGSTILKILDTYLGR